MLFDAEILHAQFADGNRHPAILIAVIMDAADQTDFPADGHNFEEITFENQISRVMALRVEEIRREGFRLHQIFADEIADALESEFARGNRCKFLHPFSDFQSCGIAGSPNLSMSMAQL